MACASRLWRVGTILFFLAAFNIFAQEPPAQHPPDYPGVKIHIPGVFVTPAPGAPFTGTVEILSKQAMPDGSTLTRRTVNHIARNSLGVIYNECRKLEPPAFRGEPIILSFHIYDPQTRLSTFLTPRTHIARQMVVTKRPTAPANTTPDSASVISSARNLRTEDLGVENFAGLPLHGTRKVRTVPAKLSGTGHDVDIIDDYWYSEELKVYLVLKHNDPRTGEQIVGITQVDRKEPAPTTFQISPLYKVVDETPVEQSNK